MLHNGKIELELNAHVPVMETNVLSLLTPSPKTHQFDNPHLAKYLTLFYPTDRPSNLRDSYGQPENLLTFYFQNVEQ